MTASAWEDTVQNCCTVFLTSSEASGLPTSVALPAQSLTIQAVLVPARPSVAICSFHEPERLGSEGGASSSQLQLSGTHCRFTFAPRPSVAVSFEQGSRLIFSDWPFTDFSEENYWRDWTELNWTKLDWERPEHRVARVLHRVKRTRRKRCCRHQASAVVSPTSAECRRTLTAAWHRCSAQRTTEVASRRDVEDSGNNLSEQQNRLIMTSLWWRDITNQFEELPSTKTHPDQIYRSHQSMELLPTLRE